MLEGVRYTVSFLGAGTYSNVVRVTAARGLSTWSFALALSRIESPRAPDYLDELSDEGKASTMKCFNEVRPELASGRLLASLRQPGFLPQYRVFIIDGPSFAKGRNQQGSLIAHIFEALQHAKDRDMAYWRKFDGELVDVLVVCMGLGDRGSLARADTLKEACEDARAVRHWLFTLQWSLLVAARTFNFTHRDLKLANMVLCDEGAGRTTFQVSLSAKERERLGLSKADAELVRHFCIERQAGELSACVPKIIDFGFASYVATSMKSSSSFSGEQRLLGTHRPALFGEVNAFFADVATYPSPDMLFLATYSNAQRDFDSDLFTFGLAALELMVGVSDLVWNLVDLASLPLSRFVDVARNALDLMHALPRERAHVAEVLQTNGRLLVTYMQLHVILHDQVLPPPESRLRQTLLYKVLDNVGVTELVTAPAHLSTLRAMVAKIERVHGPAAVDYLRACLTWDKHSRGVFPGWPAGGAARRAETPATLRLLWHPYFSPLRSSASQAATVGADNHYVLKYKDPPTARDALDAPTRFARVAQRIVAVERGLQKQMALSIANDAFEIEIDALVEAALNDSAAVPSTPSFTLAEEDSNDEQPHRKRARTLPDSYTTCTPSRGRWASNPPPLTNLWADEEILI